MVLKPAMTFCARAERNERVYFSFLTGRSAATVAGGSRPSAPRGRQAARAPLIDAELAPPLGGPAGAASGAPTQDPKAEGKQRGGPLRVGRALRTGHSHLGKAPAGPPPPAPRGSGIRAPGPVGRAGVAAHGGGGGSRQRGTPWEEGPGCTPPGRIRGQLGWGQDHTELTSTATARSRSPGSQSAPSTQP